MSVRSISLVKSFGSYEINEKSVWSLDLLDDHQYQVQEVQVDLGGLWVPADPLHVHPGGF